jgi:hypothetical protein
VGQRGGLPQGKYYLVDAGLMVHVETREGSEIGVGVLLEVKHADDTSTRPFVEGWGRRGDVRGVGRIVSGGITRNVFAEWEKVQLGGLQSDPPQQLDPAEDGEQI